jgi:hypothetical protein
MLGRARETCKRWEWTDDGEAQDGVVVLEGTAKGTYKTPGVGAATTFSETGTISPLGKVKIRGSIQYFSRLPTGTVTISSATKKQGKIFATVSTAGAGDPVYYTITGATGIFAGDTGSGVARVALRPAKGKGGAHGDVTLRFVND